VCCDASIPMVSRAPVINRILPLIPALILISAAQAQTDPCPMKTLASVDVAIDGIGQVLLPVTLDGHEVWMTLGLETAMPVLFEAAVEGWNLKTVTSPYDFKLTINGKPAEMTTIGKLELGRINFTNWHMVLYPSKLTKGIEAYAGKPVVGGLTSRFLQSVDMELDLADRKVKLFSPTKCHGGAIYWGGEYTAVQLHSDEVGLLKFAMELDGRKIETSLNTADRTSVINSEVTRKFFGFDENSPGIQQQVSPQGDKTESYIAMSLTAKGLTVKNARVRLRSAECGAHSFGSESGAIYCQDEVNYAPFSIGTDLLRHLRVYIASTEGMIYFTRVDPVAPTPAANSSAPAP
jgi:hypothetical protein